MNQTGFLRRLKLGFLVLAAVVASGCLGGGGSLTNLPTDEVAIVKLKIRLGRVDTRNDVDPAILSKSSSIEVRNMVVTFTSNLGDTVRDTVSSTDASLGTTPFLSDSILVDVKLRALRWWNIDIETHDQNDSVVHKGSAGPFSSKGGQTMDLAIPLLNSRYLMYEARYNLPTEIFSAGLTDSDRTIQKIYFYKLVLQIDGDTVRDSSSFSPAITQLGKRFIYADPTKLKGSAGKFFFKPNGTGSDTATHVQSYEYVRVGAHDFKMTALGYLEGDSVGGTAPRLLFQGSSKINVLQAGIPEEKTIKLDWIGPGSEQAAADTSKGPGSPNWSGISMTVTLGRVKSGKATVGIIGEFPEN